MAGENSDLPCAEKLAFDTKSQASGAAAAADWQYGSTLTTYKCRHCSLWHLTTQTARDD